MTRRWQSVHATPIVVVQRVRRPAARVRIEVTPAGWTDLHLTTAAERSIPAFAIAVGRLGAGHDERRMTVERHDGAIVRVAEDAAGVDQIGAAGLWESGWRKWFNRLNRIYIEQLELRSRLKAC